MIRWQRMRSRRKREKRRSWRRRHDITFCSANVCGRLRSLSRSVLPFGGALRAPSSAAGTFCRSQGSLILEWDFGHGSRYRAWPIFLCPWPDFCLLWEPCSFLWGEEQSEKKKKKKIHVTVEVIHQIMGVFSKSFILKYKHSLKLLAYWRETEFI